MTDQPPPPDDTSAAAFDLMFLRTRAAQCRLTDEDLTALTGIPTADWGTHLTPHTLPAAALLALARVLNTSPESLLRVPEHASRGSVPRAATHATVLHAALLEVGRIHPDDLASALEWTPHRLKWAATALAAHLEQPSSPQRLIHTDTAIHLTCVPGLLTGTQRQNLYNTATPPPRSPPVRPPPSPACCTAPPAASPPKCPPIRSRAWPTGACSPPDGKQPAPHPDVLFALGLAAHPFLDAADPAGHQVLGHRPAAADPGPHRHVHQADAARADFTDSLLPVPAPPQPPRSR
ncbi:hypothetical protein GCM10023237_69720 [Streptomyces coeruleoprunus]|uniref:hypothetical protein n=1 Tax=Streptomyces coeruleoprunus TaxID=285563 RepID=UPI0031F13990